MPLVRTHARCSKGKGSRGYKVIYISWTVQPNILMRLSSVPHGCWGCIATFLGFLRIFNVKLCQWRDMAYHGGSHILRVFVICMVYV